MTTDADADQATPTHCRTCQVRQGGLCEVLDPAELMRLAHQSRRTRHGPGETLAIESGEVGYANVTRGTVKLSRVLRDGRQQVVGLQFAPDLMGRLFSTESPLSAEAATDVELCRIPRSVLESLVADSDRIKLRLLAQSLRDLDAARDWMVTLGRKTAAERVASLLLLVATRTGIADGAGRLTLELPISRADMADFLGLTLETVSRQISRLRHDGVIEVRGHRSVVILGPVALEARAG
jgi:CRP/FNR family transcriptional regulator